MNDIDSLLKEIAPTPTRPDAGVVDQDLARGRAALATARRRRTYQRGGLATGAVTIAAVAGILVATSGSSTPKHSAKPLASVRNHPTTRTIAHSTPAHPQIKLAAYTGAQLAGFNVSEVPQGWHLSTSTPYALLITPDGSTNNDPDVFVNKLAVLTSSVDQHGLGPGTAVTVDGQPGRVQDQDGTLMLTYNSPNGFGINIQAPDTLGWSDAQIVAFAQGVTVTANAVHSEG